MVHTLQTPQDAAAWLAARVALNAGGRLRTDSRAVQPGDGFIAWPGYATDGRRFVPQALAAGAAACLVEAEGAEAFAFADERIAALPGLKAATGAIADQCLAQPSAVLDVVATTGTNGKTSTAWWTAQALSLLGRRCGVIGTLGVGEPPAGGRPGHVETTGLTTPDPVTLHQAFRGFVDQGFAACALEASSIGLAEQRLNAARIDVALFTNLTRDHLDYHGSMAAYGQAKRTLFAWPGLRAAVVNVDDAFGATLAAELQRGRLAVWTVSLHGAARLQARALRHEAAGLVFTVAEGEATAEVRTQLVGEFNASNLLVVLGGLRALGVPLAEAAAVAPQLTPVPGRLQRVGGDESPGGPGNADSDIEVVVDYAHTPDALAQVLRALRPLASARGGRLWCVFGCGGNRDATKRPLMGAIAAAGADHVVVTSDNPRDEVPAAILAHILTGMGSDPEAAVIEDRSAAIAHAVQGAAAGDVVLLAGKGHEDYQEVAGVKRPFSDLLQARAALRTRAAAARGRMMTLAQAQALLPGSVLVGDGSTAFARVHTDTRSMQPGDLFVALHGERFDGHDHLAAAQAAGAVAAIAERGLGAGSLPGLQVKDTLAALQQLAAAWRTQFTLPLVAVTGSNGKTTVTQMVAGMLRAAHGEAMLATAGNLNNHIGVPLTLLRLRAGQRAAVLELGMNHEGEIALLAGLARPTVALVNNAQREHLEFMATVEAVAHENGAVIAAVPEGGTVVLPADDAYTPLWRSMAGARTVWTFGLQPAADTARHVWARATWQADSGEGGAWHLQLHTPVGGADTTLALAGRHNVANAAAAAACALAAGLPLAAVARGLAGFQAVNGRSQALRLQRGGRAVTLVNDSYNANPDSVLAAIRVLAELPCPRWLVLGDMGEVGAEGPRFHAEAGAAARAAGIEHFWAAGSLCAHAGADRHFATVAELLSALPAAQPSAASVLVKGSRFMKMEQVVQALLKEATPCS